MANDTVELIETPFTCEETTEYDNRIEDTFEIEPEEEQEDTHSRANREEIEQQFARYERNYRARRIRELTIAPIVTKRGRRGRPSAKVAA